MGMSYMAEEKLRHIKQDSGLVKNLISFNVFVLFAVGGLLEYYGHIVPGIVTMVIGAITFFGLFPAEQIQKDIKEVEKYFQSLK